MLLGRKLVFHKKILIGAALMASLNIQTGLRVSISAPFTPHPNYSDWKLSEIKTKGQEDTVANCHHLLKLFSLFSVFSISFLPCFFFISDFYFCKLIIKSVKTEKKKRKTNVWAGRKRQRWTRLTSLRFCPGSVASNWDNLIACSNNPE